MRRSRDLVGSHDNLLRRARALETGAHPTVVMQGGFGRNTRWAKLTPRPPAAYEAGAAVYRRVRADVLHFYTEGTGLDITALTTFPALLFVVGGSGQPAREKRFITSRGTDPAIIMVYPNGRVYLERNPGGAGPMTVDGAVSLG